MIIGAALFSGVVRHGSRTGRTCLGRVSHAGQYASTIFDYTDAAPGAVEALTRLLSIIIEFGLPFRLPE